MVSRWLAASEIPEEEANNIGLENWQDEMGKEEFSLEAISAFGKLSTLDEPLIVNFDQLEGLTDKPTLLSNFGSAVKEILTHVPNSLVILNLFPNRWEQFQQFFDGSVVDRISQHQVQLNRPDKDKLRDILKLKAKSIEIDLNQLFEPAELEDILEQNSIRAVLNRAAAYYRYKTDNIPLPVTTTDTSKIVQTLAGNTSIETRLGLLENEVNALKQAIAGLTAPQQPWDIFSPEPITTAQQPNLDDSPSFDSVFSADQQPPSAVQIQEPQLPLVRTTDEIVADYLYQKREELEQDYDARPHIISDSDDLGKLAEIIAAFGIIQQIDIEQLRLGKKTLPEHLQLRIGNDTFVIGFLSVSGSSFTSRIKNFNQLVISEHRTKFRLIRDIREPEITGKVGKDEVEKLSHAPNGTFAIMDKADRINFELAYNLIVDIQNRDLEADLATSLRVLATKLGSYWLIQSLM